MRDKVQISSGVIFARIHILVKPGITEDDGPAPNLYTLPDSLKDARNAATLNYGYMEPDGMYRHFV